MPPESSSDTYQDLSLRLFRNEPPPILLKQVRSFDQPFLCPEPFGSILTDRHEIDTSGCRG